MAAPIHRAQVLHVPVGDTRWHETHPDAPFVFAVFTADGAVVGETVVAASEWPLTSLPPDVAARAARRRLRRRLELALRGERAAQAGEPDVTLVISSTVSGSLTACLESVAALEKPPARTIVLAPTEHRGDVERACAGHDVRVEAYEGPLAAVRSRCLAGAQTPLVAFASDECVIDRRWFARIGSPFRDRLVQAVTGYELPLHLETRAECLHRLRSGGAHGDPALVCVRASTIDQVGPFDSTLDLLSRALDMGYRVATEPDRISRRAHPSTMRELRRVRAAELRSAGFRRGARDVGGELRRQLTRDPLRAPLSLLAAEVVAVLRAAFSFRSRPRREPARESAVDESTPPIRVGGAEYPDLSVAIASHNRRDSLRSVLLHLAEQTYPADRYEVAVVLDGSSDGSTEMMRSLDVPYALRAIEQEQRGLAATRNRGAREARHPLVVFLDDDLMPVHGFLAAHAAAHRDADGAVVLGHSPPAVRGRTWWGQEIHAWWEDRYRRMREPDHRWSFVDFADGNLSLPVSLLERTGGWEDGFARRQDWELAVRLLDAGVRFSFREDATGWHHFDLSLASALANQRAAGASDIAFARRHPRWRNQLQLAGVMRASQVSSRRRELIEAVYGRPRTMRALVRAGYRALPLLETAGARGAWDRTLGRLMTTQYLFGVRDALPDESGFDELAADIEGETLPQVVVQLDSPRPPALAETGPIAVCLGSDRGTEVCVPGAVPGEQWDWDALLDKLVHEVEARARSAPVADA